MLFLTFSVLVANPKKTTLHGGQSRSWSAEKGKENKRKKWICAFRLEPTEYGVSNVSRWKVAVLLISSTLGLCQGNIISAELGRRETVVVSRCFAGCLGQARNRCSNRCFCGLRNNYTSDARPTDTLAAAGVESPKVRP